MLMFFSRNAHALQIQPRDSLKAPLQLPHVFYAQLSRNGLIGIPPHPEKDALPINLVQSIEKIVQRQSLFQRYLIRNAQNQLPALLVFIDGNEGEVPELAVEAVMRDMYRKSLFYSSPVVCKAVHKRLH